VLGNRSIDTKCQPSESPEVGYYHKSDGAKYDGFRLLLQMTGRENYVSGQAAIKTEKYSVGSWQ